MTYKSSLSETSPQTQLQIITQQLVHIKNARDILESKDPPYTPEESAKSLHAINIAIQYLESEEKKLLKRCKRSYKSMIKVFRKKLELIKH